MNRILLYTAATLSLLIPSILQAQNYVYAIGDQPFSTQIPIDGGFIAVNNGEIHMEIPLARQPQRGRLQLNERLVYDSRIWKIISNSGLSWQPTNVPNSMGGWRFVSGLETGTLQTYTQIEDIDCYEGNPSGNQPAYSNYFFIWTDPTGVQHWFTAETQQPYSDFCSGSPVNYSLPNNPTATGVAVDGSGYTISVTNYSDATVYDANGNEVYPTPMDPNGNYFSKDGSGNLVDTAGRTPVLVSQSGNQIYYDVLGWNGARERYTVTTETVSFSTSFNENQVTEASGTFTAIQSIELPDGSSYSFTYDSGSSGNYGELTKVTLPTGGTVQYNWANFKDSFQNENRWLSSVVRDGGTTTFQPVTISQCSGSSGCQEQDTVTSPDGNDTVYTFTLDPATVENASSWNTEIDVYQGSASGGDKLRSTATSYTYATTTTALGAYQGATGYTQTTSLPAVGLTSQTQTSLYVFGQPSLVKEWDYYSGSAPSNPTRQTVYGSYCGGTPSEVTTEDGSGNRIAQTTTSFDQTSLTQTSGLPNHAAVSGTRCNVTTTSQWLNTTGGSINTTMAYDDAGVVLSTTNGRGFTTTFGHDNTDSCLTSVTRPTTNSVAHVSSATCDLSTGLPASATDESGNTTTYNNYDAFGRLLQVTYPDGGQATFSYPSPTEMTESHLQTSTASITTTTTYDSYGRKIHVTLSDPEGNDTVDYTYDTDGRLYTQSNPHRGSPLSTDGTTTFYYDALDRIIRTQNPDGTYRYMNYVGNTVTSTDETGRQAKQVTNAFGWLTSVFEPDSSGNLSIETDYQHDLLGNVTQVDQWGGPNGSTGDRRRTSVYDSVSRLIEICNPESIPAGGTCSASGPWSEIYGYDNNGDVVNSTDARSVTMSYYYDALNRLTSRGASDGSVEESYSYDNTTGGSSGIGRLFGAFGTAGKSGTGYYYDKMGRVDGTSYDDHSGTWEGGYAVQYDLTGEMTSLTYPDGRVVKRTWDTAGHLQTVTYDNWNGEPVGFNYLASATYWPDGSPNTMTFGDGSIETESRNNRLQPSELAVQINSAGVSQTVFDKQYAYTSSCQAYNNGDVAEITDALNSNRSQGFCYDNLNRVGSFASTDGSMQQTFTLDPWGNMTSSGTLTSSHAFDAQNQITDSGYGYDAAGNMTSAWNGVSSVTYGFDALERMTSADSGATVLTYDAENQRVRKDDSEGTWTEYVYYGGQPLAQMDNTGAWADYIYANGQLITRADDFDIFIHTHGTTPGNATAAWDIPGPSYTIKQGDQLLWRQIQWGGGYGGPNLQFSDGSQTLGVLKDNSGQTANAWQTQGEWQARGANLSNYAGKTITAYEALTDSSSPAGTYDIYYADMAILSQDGTVTPIYYRQLGGTISLASNTGQTNLSADEESNVQYSPQNNFSFYYGDQIGSTRIATASGYPISSDTYYPFGQEPDSTSGGFKFAGLERDSESGLDQALYRQYSSATGRWMSPDPYNGSFDFRNPQSFNRYAYVSNNPLSFTDPSGQFMLPPPPGCPVCAGVVAGIDAIAALGDIFGWWESSFHGSLRPRPSVIQTRGNPYLLHGIPTYPVTEEVSYPFPNLGGYAFLGAAAGASLAVNTPNTIPANGVAANIEDANKRFNECVAEKLGSSVADGAYDESQSDSPSTSGYVISVIGGGLEVQRECLIDNPTADLSPNYRGLYHIGDLNRLPWPFNLFSTQ